MSQRTSTREGRIYHAHGLRGGASAYHLAGLGKRVVYLTGSPNNFDAVARDLATFAPESRIIKLPPLDGNAYARMPLHESTKRARILAFDAILRNRWDFLIISPQNLLEALAPPEHLVRPCLELEAGESYDLSQLCLTLVNMGYTSVDLVSQPGDFARRGGILDIYSLVDENPIRLDFFDDELEEIRWFNPENQRGFDSLERKEILPHHEWHVTPEALETFGKKGGGVWNGTGVRENFLQIVAMLRDVGKFAGHLHWARFFFNETQSLADLLPEDTFLFVEDDTPMREALAASLELMEAQRFEAEQNALIHAPCEKLLAAASLKYPDGWTVMKHHGLATANVQAEFVTQSVARYQNQGERFLKDWQPYFNSHVVVLVLHSSVMAKRVREWWKEENFAVGQTRFPLAADLEPGLYLAIGQLERGFLWQEKYLAVIAERDIWTKTAPVRRPVRAKKLFNSDFRDLKVGDLVVHQDHGIGRFLGLVEMDAGGVGHEMMALGYKGGDKLYVSLNQLDLVQRHSVQNEALPLDKMGGNVWKRTRQRVKQAVRDMAEELLKLYAEREVVKGQALSGDTPWQVEFEDAFEYEPTEDQLRATQEIKRDMERDKPMDRLLVGDVGFGKTEVAMRMAFKVVMAGGQAAVLCPTTVLAFQHYITFKRRFASFPVNIGWISRFSKASQVRENLKALADGKLDIMIGTHRLLSSDVAFKNLRALVIDEEQRFGVAHKERLKHARKNVHVLSMSATPIPRTMNMALSGIRDISVIETPPSNRLAISTSVVSYNESLIRNAIQFELDRKGQVYFIHNRVETMETQVTELKKILPNARIVMAHGQMEAKTIEQVMLSFMKHEADVLVASTIIENGVDISNANTMLINQSHHFGLSQLYQLRGRIGRSDRPAFAYLLVPGKVRMTPEARQRLAAMEEFSDLGAGFRIAAMDMEVRGAGNMLGGAQAGHVNTVGYDLYLRLLEEAVHEIRGDQVEDEVHCVLTLNLGAALPKSYIPNTNQRLHYYKRFACAKDEGELDDLMEELKDCHGEPPVPTLRLDKENRMRLFLSEKKIPAVERDRSYLKLRFHESSQPDIDKILAWVKRGDGHSLSPEGVLTAPLGSKEPEQVYARIRELVAEVLPEQEKDSGKK